MASSSLPNSSSGDSEALRLNSAVSSRFSTVSETAVLIRSGGQQQQQHEQLDPQQLDKVYARISMRLMPLFLAVMILNHVDRTNLAYACESHRPAAALALHRLHQRPACAQLQACLLLSGVSGTRQQDKVAAEAPACLRPLGQVLARQAG